MFLYSNQRSRGHAFNCIRPYSAAFTAFAPLVLTRCFEYAAQYRLPALRLVAYAPRRCAIVAVRLGEAEFEGQTKQKLGSPEVRAIVSEVAGERLSEFLQRQPKALSAIIDKAQAAQKAADAAKA